MQEEAPATLALQILGSGTVARKCTSHGGTIVTENHCRLMVESCRIQSTRRIGLEMAGWVRAQENRHWKVDCDNAR